MNKLKLIFVFAISFILLSEGIAQKKRVKKKEQTEKSTVIVFDDEEQTKEEVERTKSYINIKTNPMSFLFGYQMIEAEKQITDYLSVQVGAGVTFKDLSKTIDDFDEIIDQEDVYSPESPNWNTDVTDYYYADNTRKSKLGFCFTLSPRFFYASDGFEGGYIAPTFTYKRYNFNAADFVDRAYTTDFIDPENLNYTDFTVRYGYNTLFETMMTESFVGVGYRTNSSHRQDIGYNAGGLIGKTFQDFSYSGIRLELGIRVGFQL